jgi:hypothetical protein
MALTKLNSAGLPAGSVLQVKSATETSTTTMTTSSYADVAGLSVSITPSSTSSKILVIVNILISPANNMGVLWKVVRDATDIAVNNASSISTGGNYSEAGSNARVVWNGNSISHLDSPTTTSAITYKVQARGTTSSTFGINRRTSGADFGGVSSITLMEIAG